MSTFDPNARATVSGSIVALPTPFRDGALDLAGLDRLIDFQSRQATTGVIVGGATGEAWSLSIDEVSQLVGRATESAAHHSSFRMHVYFAVVDADSRGARDRARAAIHAGADGVCVSAPPFVRPDAAGLVRHFVSAASRIPRQVPVILMNEPMRTGSDLTPAIAAEIIDEVPQVAAHCEGLGYPGRARTLAEQLSVPVLCGDDRMIGPYLRGGAVGAVSTVGNLVPGEVARLIAALEQNDSRSDTMERHLAPLIDALRIGTAPVPLKAALGALEAISDEVRAPLAPLDATRRGALEQSLSAARLLVPAG